jgi:hypothetical protein
LDSKRISIADMEFFLEWRVKVVQFKAVRSSFPQVHVF